MPIEETENEIRTRIQSSGKYDSKSFRQKPFPPGKPEPGVSALYGCPKGKWSGGKCQVGVEIQSLRFSKDERWTLSKARAWLKEHDFKIAAGSERPGMMLQYLVAAKINEGKNAARIYVIDETENTNRWGISEECKHRLATTLLGKPLLGPPEEEHEGHEVGRFTHVHSDGFIMGEAELNREAYRPVASGQWDKVSPRIYALKMECSVCGEVLTDKKIANHSHIRSGEAYVLITDAAFDHVAFVDKAAYERAGVLDVFEKEMTLGFGPALFKALSLDAKVFGGRAVPVHQTPKANEDKEWDSGASEARFKKWAGGPDREDVNWGKYAKGFAWFNSEDPENFGAYKLPHHDIVNGQLVVVWRGVAASMGALMGARGGVKIPTADKRAAYRHLAGHYRQFDKEPPRFEGGQKKKMEAVKVSDEIVPSPGQDTPPVVGPGGETQVPSETLKTLEALKVETEKTLAEQNKEIKSLKANIKDLGAKVSPPAKTEPPKPTLESLEKENASLKTEIEGLSAKISAREEMEKSELRAKIKEIDKDHDDAHLEAMDKENLSALLGTLSRIVKASKPESSETATKRRSAAEAREKEAETKTLNLWGAKP